MEEKIKCPHCNYINDDLGEIFTVGTLLLDTDEPPLPHAICTNCKLCIGCDKEYQRHLK